MRYNGSWKRRNNAQGGRYPTEEGESREEPSYRHKQRFYYSEGHQPEEMASDSYRNGPGRQSNDEQYYTGPGSVRPQAIHANMTKSNVDQPPRSH